MPRTFRKTKREDLPEEHNVISYTALGRTLLGRVVGMYLGADGFARLKVMHFDGARWDHDPPRDTDRIEILQ